MIIVERDLYSEKSNMFIDRFLYYPWGVIWWLPPSFKAIDKTEIPQIISPSVVGGNICGTCRRFQPEITLIDDDHPEVHKYVDNLEIKYGYAVQGCCLYYFPIIITNIVSWDGCPYYLRLAVYLDDELK
jgi:hypothetical protein